MADPLPSSPAPRAASASRARGASPPPTASRCSTSTPRRRAGGGRPRRCDVGALRHHRPRRRSATAIDDVVAECGGIDVCISNAGIAAAGALRHLDPDVLAAQLNVNLIGNWRVHPRVPAARHRAPRVRAGRRLAGRARRAAGHRRLRRVQGRPRATAQRAAHRGRATSASTSAWPISPGSTPTWSAAPSTAIPASRHAQGAARPGGQDAAGRRCRRRDRRAACSGARAGSSRRASSARCTACGA